MPMHIQIPVLSGCLIHVHLHVCVCVCVCMQEFHTVMYDHRK